MGYQTVNNWAEVSWEMDNSSHGDDQLLVIPHANFLALVVADGVGSCEVGRLCSAILTYHLKQVFNEEVQNFQYQQLEDVEKFMGRVVWDACARTTQEVEQLLIQNFNESDGADEKPFDNIIRALKLVQKEIDKLGSSVLSDISKQVKLWIPRLDSQQKEMAYRLSSDTKRLQEIAQDLTTGIGETRESIVNGITDRLHNRTQQENWDFTTTLCFALIFFDESRQTFRLMSLSLGDSKITILSPEKGWIRHYELEVPKIPTYVSTKRGIVGELDIAMRTLQPHDCVVVSSDGGKIEWTTPGGVPGIPFTKLLNYFLKDRRCLNGFAEAWINKLSEKKALHDDATLIMARVLDSSHSQA